MRNRSIKTLAGGMGAWGFFMVIVGAASDRVWLYAVGLSLFVTGVALAAIFR